MKKILSMILALSMILTLLAGCGTAAAPASDPDPVDDVVEVTPVATPTTVEGVVKDFPGRVVLVYVEPGWYAITETAAPAGYTVTNEDNRIIVALADGSTLFLDTSKIADLDVHVGDTVKVEYTGEIGSMVATSVTVTEKAEIPTATVTGTVTKIEDGFVFLTLEDGSEAALKSESVEEYDVEVGDTLTIEYVDTDAGDGVDVVSVEVTKSEKDAENEAPAVETVPETTAPAAGIQAGNSGATGNTGAAGSTSSGSTGSTGSTGSSGSGSSQASQVSQVSAKKADETYPAVVIETRRFDGYNSTVFQHKDGSTNTVADAESVAIGLNGRNFQVGDEVVFGWVMNGTGRFARELSYIELTKAGSGSYDEDYDDYDDDDEEDYTPSSKPSSGSGSSQPEDAGDVYEAIRLINAERVKAGLSELEIDSTLMEMAAIRAEEIVEKYEHYRPNGLYFSSLFEEYDWKYSLCKENADSSKASASKTVERWMNSSAHRSNILNSEITKIGLGYYYDGDSEWKYHWVMLAATPR